MKATGIVRRIDDLGRVVIPKEIRRTLRIREGDPLEIFTDREGEIILKKYSPINELNEFAAEYAEALYENIGFICIISDRDSIVAISGGSRKEYLDKRISPELEKIIEDREIYSTSEGKSLIRISIDEMDPEIYTTQLIVPIVAQGDPIGSVTLLSKEPEDKVGEIEIKVAQTAAGFLSKQMED
ncbi:stage V sporulation protein T [Gottschalkia acidurici 9a]|uniref:Stage V sporulation protein T n=1 Tax=Gottschalkia acidurici (strain ATCC 7906 / DSM 604 / BCRC 14475 / CIP 104303 / KCTC 5404 / NCIMB 10678 / 9a) TaxID=1128398 RepID=K0B4B4_GOTA9|nr:stage V sporulation protein T [Gottschalkia acidurici]AFS79376.1 stage V sporulation protein T [Gottschalkia acidurici 9a]